MIGKGYVDNVKCGHDVTVKGSIQAFFKQWVLFYGMMYNFRG
jgi:hypothetical protein